MDARIAKCIVSKMVPSKDEKRYYITLTEPSSAWDITVNNTPENRQPLAALWNAHEAFTPVEVVCVLASYVYDRSMRLIADTIQVRQVQSAAK
jgi:hypothetical protein